MITEFGVMQHHDAAEARINGRYPDAGFAINHASDMVVRVIEGAGTIATRDNTIDVQNGSVIFIDKETPYYYESHNMVVYMVSSPPWTPEQYENVT